jgi:hypothetical protein
MHPAIKIISNYGIPTNSAIRAIQYLGEKEDYTSEQYFSMIEELTGHGINIADPRQTKYSFLYIIQDIINTSFNTDAIDLHSILLTAQDKAKKFIAENPWVFAVVEETIKVDNTGKPKRKKGAKQEEALRIYKENISEGKQKIIELFMSELDMSKPGATTYFYNAKKKVG